MISLGISQSLSVHALRLSLKPKFSKYIQKANLSIVRNMD